MSYYLLGQGKLYAALRDAGGVPGGYLPLGNCPRLALSLGAGALPQSGLLARSGTLPAFNLDLDDLNATNLAMVLAGDKTDVAAGSTTETVKSYKGCLIPLSKIDLSSFTSLVNGATTYVNGVDYTVNLATGSLEIPANSSIPNGQSVVATYAYADQTIVGAYTANSSFHALRFEGYNQVDGVPVVAELFKARFDPVDSIDLIGDNFSVLQVRGNLYVDDRLATDSPDGRFMRIRQTQHE